MTEIINRNNRNPIVFTGLGCVSPVGIGTDLLWNALMNKTSGIRYCSDHVLPEYPVYNSTGGFIVPSPNPLCGCLDFDPKKHIANKKSIKLMSRDIQLGLVAGSQAIENANGLGKSTNNFCTSNNNTNSCSTNSSDTASYRLQTLDQYYTPDRIGVNYAASFIPSSIEDVAPLCAMCLEQLPDGQKEFIFDLWGENFYQKMPPLWLLKYLPNMVAGQIGILYNLQGPSNSIIHDDAGALSAIIESCRVIERGNAEAMVVGGVGNLADTFSWVKKSYLSRSENISDPAGSVRPFDAHRDGLVPSEAAGCFVLENMTDAVNRGAVPMAAVVAWAERFEPSDRNGCTTGKALKSCLDSCLKQTGVRPDQIAHINAHGLGCLREDQIEAEAIADVLPNVPVLAVKGCCGYARAGSTAIEMAMSVRSLVQGIIPPARNYQTPDPKCPINVVHDLPMETDKQYAIKLTCNRNGAAAAIMIERV